MPCTDGEHFWSSFVTVNCERVLFAQPGRALLQRRFLLFNCFLPRPQILSAETLHQLVENFKRALFAQGSFAKEISSFHFCLPRLCKEKPECCDFASACWGKEISECKEIAKEISECREPSRRCRREDSDEIITCPTMGWLRLVGSIKFIGLFCRIFSLVYASFAKATYNLIDIV